MTKPKTLEQLPADKERAETQLAQEQHKLERLENRLSQGQIGVISAPICAFCRHSLGGFSIVSVQPCLLFSDSGSKVGQTRCARTHSNSVSSSIAPEATARPTSTTSSFVQSSRIPLTSRAELIYD